MDSVRDIAVKLLDWHSKKVESLRAASAAAKEGTTFVVGESKLVATKREALFFQLGVEAALAELGQLPIKLTPQKRQRTRARED